MWFQYLIQLSSLSTSTDNWRSINNECNTLSTPFPLLGNNLQLSGIAFFFLTLFNFNLFQSTLDIKTGVKNVYLFIHVITRFCHPQVWIFYQIWIIFQSQGSGFWPKKLQKIQMPHLCPYPPPFPSKHWYVHYKQTKFSSCIHTFNSLHTGSANCP